jgi:hypothetical protein
MSYHLKIANKKLGGECAFAVSSYIIMVGFHHYVTLIPGSIESYIFYAISAYLLFLYLNIALCNPGRLNEK